MNAAVRGVVRKIIHDGGRSFAVQDGYQGLVDGGTSVRELGWWDVAGILHNGGTFIGTARCMEFQYQRNARKKAVHNLLSRGIHNLVIIGGDGSLTGAMTFFKEWPSFVMELVWQWYQLVLISHELKTKKAGEGGADLTSEDEKRIRASLISTEGLSSHFFELALALKPVPLYERSTCDAEQYEWFDVAEHLSANAKEAEEFRAESNRLFEHIFLSLYSGHHNNHHQHGTSSSYGMHLNVVGMVGSIDNDMSGTDMTIGADTAMHRICTAIDQICSTAASHNRVFVVEVMGRNCGWLALKSAVASGADWVFIPERPAEPNWREQMTLAVQKGRLMGKRSSIIVVAEGAHEIGDTCPKITAEGIRQVLADKEFDARVTILGHVQRGGSPSAFDRNMALLQGFKAASQILKQKPFEPQLVGLAGNSVVLRPLKDCLQLNADITRAIKQNDFDLAMNLRGSDFFDAYQTMSTLMSCSPSSAGGPPEKESCGCGPGPNPEKKSMRIGMLHIGACAPGMNAAVRALVRLGIDKGHKFFGIYNGVDGIVDVNNVREFNWMTVNGWSSIGGALLGTNRVSQSHFDVQKIFEAIVAHKLDAIVMMGGWDGYESMLGLYHYAAKHVHLSQMPIVMIPCSISNNLPSTEASIGCDTALNSIVFALDKIKQTAIAQRRVYVVEVMGSECGYLALFSCIASGAEKAYIPEHRITLSSLDLDLRSMHSQFSTQRHMSICLISEKTSKTFSTQFMRNLFEENSDNMYDVRVAILGHIQQGGDPTPMDRVLAVSFAAEAIKHLDEIASRPNYVPLSSIDVNAPLPAESPKPEAIQPVAIGLVKGKIVATTAVDMIPQMDRAHRRPLHQWWLKHVRASEVFSKVQD